MNKICLGISGAISAAIIPAYIMLLKATFKGLVINVIQTENSRYFLAPGAFKHLPNVHLFTSLEQLKDLEQSHMSVVDGIDMFIVCPATANMLGKLANGIADDLLSLCFLAANVDKIILPAMNYDMYKSKPVQRNIAQLKEDGCHILCPREGVSVQSGSKGQGALEEPGELIKLIKQICMIN